jgi:UDP-N-acetylmuramoyl-L-alanyl-D-glutamate--2,6-diaminopimelate ligase
MIGGNMRLDQLLNKADFQVKKGSVEIDISTLVFDSREIIEGSVFVCMVGARLDGHDYIKKAVEMGAKAIVVEKEVEFSYDGITLIYTPNARKTLAFMSAAYFNYPASKLKIIGITGTKGKTTTAYMVHSILEMAGLRTGLIGTIETIIGDEIIPANNTTPESSYVQEYFNKMVLAGCECVVMEVSSQGLMLYRVGGFTFDYGIFTNLEPDHIGPGEHKDLSDYIACKAKLFSQCKVGILNADDSHLAEVLLGHTCLVETYGLSEAANLRATNVDLHNKDGNLLVTYDVKGLLDFTVQVNIPGKFSVYNSLTAIAICRHFNVSEEKIKEALLLVKVKGRVEPIAISKHFTLMIDYAHNAMSLDSVLSTLREYHPKRLVCMFGCGGNRSRDRRYEMGEISSNKADFTVVTSDNPRYEEPEAIIEDILIGVKKGTGEYVAIIDRKEAIRYCILNAKEGDVILLAGKGHEDYQEICGQKHHMDERDLIQEILIEMTEEERIKLN